MSFVLVDYHKGNIKSVERGLALAGANVVVSDNPAVLARARAIVLPGVGAFTDAMNTLDELGLTSVLRERIEAGVPFLGICLGLHLLFEAGTEHAPENAPTHGLGVLDGVADKMPRHDHEGRAYKIPHVGWNSLSFVGKPCPLFDGIDEGEYFYFTHSYIAPETPYAVALTRHSLEFPAAVMKENVFGVQFHPEKSSTAGAKVLANFVSLAKA